MMRDLNFPPENGSPIVISPEELQNLLSESRILIEADTLISGMIRLLKYREWFVLQEKSIKNEHLIRYFTNEQVAEALMRDRLEVYEKMWDGCGCKIDYYK